MEYPDKKICIVWDSASFHKGQEIKKALKKGCLLDRVHLIPMPPYAPDNNPIEHVWNDAKGAIANIQRDTILETKAAFMNHIGGRKLSNLTFCFAGAINDFVRFFNCGNKTSLHNS